MTPVKPEKNTCPASALFQCSLVRSDAADAAADYKATPPPPMKNSRRAAGHKTTQRSGDVDGASLMAFSGAIEHRGIALHRPPRRRRHARASVTDLETEGASPMAF